MVAAYVDIAVSGHAMQLLVRGSHNIEQAGFPRWATIGQNAR